MPTLQTLSSGKSTIDGQIIPLFDFLFTPALETLELRDMDRDNWRDFTVWMEHAGAPKFAKLRSLVLINISFGNHIDNSFAGACPLLRHIAICDERFDCNTITTLARWLHLSDDRGHALTGIQWIHLHTLTLSSMAVSSKELRCIIDGRNAAGVPLRKIRLNSFFMTDNAINELESFIQVETFQYRKMQHRLHYCIDRGREDEVDWTRELWRSPIDE
jgi:hypothetical protein